MTRENTKIRTITIVHTKFNITVKKLKYTYIYTLPTYPYRQVSYSAKEYQSQVNQLFVKIFSFLFFIGTFLYFAALHTWLFIYYEHSCSVLLTVVTLPQVLHLQTREENLVCLLWPSVLFQ